MADERLISIMELRRHDGDNLPMMIAFNGVVYDVCDCPHWKSGLHEGLHFPGQDLTDELPNAPHGEEVFSLACVQKAGRLITD